MEHLTLIFFISNDLLVKLVPHSEALNNGHIIWGKQGAFPFPHFLPNYLEKKHILETPRGKGGTWFDYSYILVYLKGSIEL